MNLITSLVITIFFLTVLNLNDFINILTSGGSHTFQYTRLLRGQYNKSIPTQNKEDLKCQKYIILTRQRSGSTWFCNLLDLQNGITCGGSDFVQGIRMSELMMGKRYKPFPEYSWSDYEKQLSPAFQDAVEASSCGSSSEAGAAGFKLMINQVPRQFVDDGQLFDYFKKNDIIVLHLIREARILRYGSLENAAHFESENGGNMNTIDPSVAQLIQEKDSSITWSKQTVRDILKEEERDKKLEESLSKTLGSQYYRIRYESLLKGDELRAKLTGIIWPLYPISSSPSNFNITLDSKMIKLHKRTCVERVENYEQMRLKIVGSRTATACDYLDRTFGDAEEEEI